MNYLQEKIHALVLWYSARNRWWVPLVAGIFISLCQPPFNHESHLLLFWCPCISFFSLLPLFAFSLESSRKRAIIKTYLFGITASLSQFYWIANVQVEGLWLTILGALTLLTLFMATSYIVYGMIFRLVNKFAPRYSFVVFPSAWVVIDWLRTRGEMSFPWDFTGYALTPLLALVQIASVTGVYGLTFLIVCGNIALWEFLRAINARHSIRNEATQLAVVVLLLGTAALWGAYRLAAYKEFNDSVKLSLVQPNMDQGHWNGRVSLDTAMAITEKLVYKAGLEHPDILLLPESGVYCFLDSQFYDKRRVLSWRDSVCAPMLLGSLHFERVSNNPYYKFKVYNSALFLDTGTQDFQFYHKIKLVPFSESLPFEGLFPILSRVNLGQSDFKRGNREVIFDIDDTYYTAPFLCYEIIFPDFVRHRVAAGANILINLTNDGWWGRSNGPFQHAAMARMRCIENGVPLARCANSGISMLVDPVGRVLSKTRLYERTLLTGKLPLAVIPTFYTRYGDWVVWLSCCIIGIFCAALFFRKKV